MVRFILVRGESRDAVLCANFVKNLMFYASELLLSVCVSLRFVDCETNRTFIQEVQCEEGPVHHHD